jgi:hypothetical protein
MSDAKLTRTVPHPALSAASLPHGRLGAFALCNLIANHAGNKRLARRLLCVREMSTLLRTSPVLEIQSAAAACIYNVACKTDKEEVLVSPQSG